MTNDNLNSQRKHTRTHKMIFCSFLFEILFAMISHTDIVISVPNRFFTITIKEADVRYIKCNAPSNYTHTVQDGLIAQSKHDHQVPGYFFGVDERADERIEFRRCAHAGFRASPIYHVACIAKCGV